MMPEWGTIRQKNLENARVAVIGAGGVKSVLLYNLAAAGVGHIDIYDHDTVDLSNLNRQILYTTDDIGKSKALISAYKLRQLNPEIEVIGHAEKIDSENIENLLGSYEIIVEGGDSPAGRNLINEFCLKKSINFIHASAQFSYGYVFSVLPKRKSACFCCFFPTDYTRKISTGAVPVNTLSTSVAGAIGASEVMKYFLGYEDNMLYDKRLCFSSLLLSGEFTTENQPRRADCPVCSRIY